MARNYVQFELRRNIEETERTVRGPKRRLCTKAPTTETALPNLETTRRVAHQPSTEAWPALEDAAAGLRITGLPGALRSVGRAGDVDGDGCDDLAIGYLEGDGQKGQVRVWMPRHTPSANLDFFQIGTLERGRVLYVGADAEEAGQAMGGGDGIEDAHHYGDVIVGFSHGLYVFPGPIQPTMTGLVE